MESTSNLVAQRSTASFFPYTVIIIIIIILVTGVVTDAPPVAVKQANLDDNNTSSGK